MSVSDNIISEKKQMDIPCSRDKGSVYERVKSNRFWKKPAGMMGQSSLSRTAVVRHAFWRMRRSFPRFAFTSSCHTGWRFSGFNTLPKRSSTSRFAPHFFLIANKEEVLMATWRAVRRLAGA